MRPNESFVGQPIRSLQTMLRVIAEADENQRSVIPDGIYGTDTRNAVSDFQRNRGLPITGITDETTWNAIVENYELALTQIGPAQPLEIVLNPNQIITQGEHNPNIYLVQAMLIVLSQIYDSITEPAVTGTLDIATANALSAFQELSLLPATGELDKITWKHLALHYPMAANIQTREK